LAGAAPRKLFLAAHRGREVDMDLWG
jgi:hypothetical protein